MEAPGDHGKYALHVCLRQIHRQALDDDQCRGILLSDAPAPVVHGGHGDLRDRTIFRQKPLPDGNGLRQVKVIPAAIALHPVAPRVQPAGDVDDRTARMLLQPRAGQPVQHDGAGNDAAVHGFVPVRQGEIILQAADGLLGLAVADRTAPAALLGAGIDRLQHRLRHAGERDRFLCLHGHSPFYAVGAS